MKNYEAIFVEDQTEGVFAISLVNSPATKETFIALSDQEKTENREIKFTTASEDEQILIGLVLEPNQKIYRNDGEEEYTVEFKEHTIKKLAYNFFKQDFHKNSTYEHDQDQKIKGITFVESWLVRNSKKDVSNEYGLEYPKGSWLATMKVDDEKVWNDYVKTGKVKGFSIDGLVQLKEIKNKKRKKSKVYMADNKILLGINEILKKLNLKSEAPEQKEPIEETSVEETEVKLGSVLLEGGELMIEYEGETLEAGISVFAKMPEDEEGERVPVPVGEWKLEDGRVMLIEEEGVVASVTSPESQEAPASEETVEAESESESSQKIKSILIKYKEASIIESVEKVLVSFKEKQDKVVEDLKSQILELSEQEVETKKPTPTVVDFSSMTEFEKRKYYRANG